MQITFIGLIILIAGSIILFNKSVEAMLSFTMICTLMGGSAVFVITALGSSSIPPVNVAGVFLILRIFLPSEDHTKPIKAAIYQNRYFLVFSVYALMSAFLLPRLFAGQIQVVPMRVLFLRSLFDTVPLQFTSQNITSPVYIIGSCLIALTCFVGARERLGAIYFAKSAIVIAWFHVAFGLLGVILPAPVWQIVKAIFRNGSYAQVDQSIGGHARIAGIMPEPSSYAAYGFVWFVLLVEFWLRDILPRRAGPAAAVLALVLVFSTSSTAYLSIGCYAVILLLRMIMFPDFFSFRKIFSLAGSGLVLAIAVLILIVFRPSVWDEMVRIVHQMTIEKASSDSGLQRAFWARQGLVAFKESYGVGIGVGSFRSSNILTAIMGSTGVVGLLSFSAYLIQIFRPLRNSTFARPADPLQSVGVSCSWAAVAFLIPALASAASPDPGAVFAIFAGVALALRSLPPRLEPKSRPQPHLPLIAASTAEQG